MATHRWSVVVVCNSSIRRGLLGLVLAPLLVALPFLVILLLALNIGPGIGLDPVSLHVQFREVGIVLVGFIGGTIALGLPAWFVLRSTERESSLTYGLAGLAEGLIAAFHFGYSGSGSLRVDQAIGFALLGLIGCAIGLVFWRFARVRSKYWISCGPSETKKLDQPRL